MSLLPTLCGDEERHTIVHKNGIEPHESLLDVKEVCYLASVGSGTVSGFGYDFGRTGRAVGALYGGLGVWLVLWR